MDNMSSEEARNKVLCGLDRRKNERNEAVREAKLEQYELEQIRACNAHFRDAKLQRQKEEAGRMNLERMFAAREAKAKALAQEAAKEQAVIEAVKRYIVVCLSLPCLTIFTYLPMWAAATLVVGLGLFPAAYIFRIYFPAD